MYIVVQGFAKLCYTLVQTGSIKMTASLDTTGERLIFPFLDLSLDLARQVNPCSSNRGPPS
jgi:hypothetical protein